ncbi:MAG: tRNA (N(6)-L-threonylcarbamoyladenosine(37)-C(2))-methylthiotransferase MtaB [Christensenellales bacterium]|jgi:threonylcarbamoyladenosine tRNA methylthiotransferase MtaB
MRIAFHTLGCKANQYDTQAMQEAAIEAGHTIVDFDGQADAYIINSCTVTAVGAKKSRQAVRQAKRRNPNALVCMAGCYSKLEPEEAAKTGADIVLGTRDRSGAIRLIESAVLGEEAYEISESSGFERLSISRHGGHTRAFIKIQDGCDNFCSYCIIPYARGRSCSRPIEDIGAEAKELARHHLEAVITGIHIASYGRDTAGSLKDAIGAISDAGFKRVRLGSLEPGALTPEFLSALSNMPNICPQFHVSMQSGSAGVLERMNRKYTPKDYANNIERLREFYPGAAITTDIIAGFPGETEKEHQETLEFVEKIGFSRIHVFPFSKRKGTPAYNMKECPKHVKLRRAAELIDLGGRLEAEYAKKYEGMELNVLFEEEKDGEAEGYTENYIKVRVKGGIAGRIMDVYAVKFEDGLMRGVLQTPGNNI